MYRIDEDFPLVYSVGSDNDDDGGMLHSECEGDPANCMAYSQNMWPYREQSGKSYLGDWLIWSAMKRGPKSAPPVVEEPP